MTKLYEPDFFISYIIYYNEGNKKMLYSACGRPDAVGEYCKEHKIDYSNCQGDKVGDIFYLETKCLKRDSSNKR